MLKRVHMFFSKRNKKGFTLIELLIVVAIIAILAAIAIPQFSAYRRRGYNSASISDLRNVRTLEEAMFADFQDYGKASAGAGTLTLAGAASSTVSSQAQLSNGVTGVIYCTASGTPSKNTTYTAGATHAAGDTVYGIDSDISAMFRQPCGTVGACDATDIGKVPNTPVAGSNDFAAPWLQM